MPRIGANFIFDSKSPNFERDRFSTKEEMTNVDDRFIDEGHISYCEETGRHYSYLGTGTEFKDRWREIATTKFSNENYETYAHKRQTIDGDSTHSEYPTARAVYNFVNSKVTNASYYLGTISEISSLSETAKTGDFYRVSSEWEGVHIGDIIIAEKNNPEKSIDGQNWTLLHNEINTDESTTLEGHYTPETDNDETLNASGAEKTSDELVQVITGIEKDSKGHLTGIISAAVRNTDTKNTAGSTDTSDKIYLIGAKEQTSPVKTYSHDTVYVGEDGKLYSDGDVVFTEQSTSDFIDDKIKSLNVDDINEIMEIFKSYLISKQIKINDNGKIKILTVKGISDLFTCGYLCENGLNPFFSLIEEANNNKYILYNNKYISLDNYRLSESDELIEERTYTLSEYLYPIVFIDEEKLMFNYWYQCWSNILSNPIYSQFERNGDYILYNKNNKSYYITINDKKVEHQDEIIDGGYYQLEPIRHQLDNNYEHFIHLNNDENNNCTDIGFNLNTTYLTTLIDKWEQLMYFKDNLNIVDCDYTTITSPNIIDLGVKNDYITYEDNYYIYDVYNNNKVSIYTGINYNDFNIYHLVKIED